jgi:ribosomal protein S18 acetylase RimI-like enzyme
MTSIAFKVRLACPDDVPALVQLKWQLALAENATHVVRASEADWHRDMFGPQPRFLAVVAEADATVIGMATITQRFSPGWVGALFCVNDLFVQPAFRRKGIGEALLALAAAEALGRGAPFLEIMVREDNPARRLYRKIGFMRVRGAETHVLAGEALAEIAGVTTSVKSA